MTEKYYVDTSIWMDLVEDRKGYNNEPLGDYALKLFAMIKAKKHRLVVSDLLLAGLNTPLFYSDQRVIIENAGAKQKIHQYPVALLRLGW